MDPGIDERIVWRAELAARLGVSSEAVRRYMRDGKLPPPDVKLSQRQIGWKLSTLEKAGIRLF